MKSGTKKFLLQMKENVGVWYVGPFHAELTKSQEKAVNDATSNNWIEEKSTIFSAKTLQMTARGITALEAAIASPSVFDDDSRPYGTTDQRGNPSTWKASFEEAQETLLSDDEAERILGYKNPWKILGVSKLASFDEIKAAFRKASKQAHPDHGGSKEKMQEILAAWAVLNKLHKATEAAKADPFSQNPLTKTETPMLDMEAVGEKVREVLGIKGVALPEVYNDEMLSD